MPSNNSPTRRAQRKPEAEARASRNAASVIDCPCGNRHVAGWSGCRLGSAS